ncbi:MAG: AMP-binding protein [Clostridiales bacterium]|nr:AMP-binding protein [Clostridiales bacterium]
MKLIKKTIAECLEERVHESESRIAVMADGQSCTWGQLDYFSDLAAIKMIQDGVGKGTHVGLYGTNSPNWIISFLALEKTGGSTCPVQHQLHCVGTGAVDHPDRCEIRVLWQRV